MRKLKVETNTELEKAVLKKINFNCDAYDDIEDYINDVLQHGCISGMVSGLIYYSETIAFFKKHREDINALLSELISDIGEPVDVLFGDKWDGEDPLAFDTNNQNLLAWFGFEETVRQLADRAGIEV